jgi:hypothetical protein
MLHRLMGREVSLAANREYLEMYRDSRDHPLIEEYLAVMRKHAPDVAVFDAYVNQWFYGTVVPQYLIEESSVAKTGAGWEVKAKVKNTGTGRMPIDVAAVRGVRFPKKDEKEKKDAKDDAWQIARATVTLDAGESAEVRIPCTFEPARLVVDPDVHVLMLERKKAEVALKTTPGAGETVAQR